MKYLKTRYILSIAAAFGILISTCSMDTLQMSGGTTTETTNGYITGSLVKTDGMPARQTIVRLIHSQYDPVKDGPVPDSLIDTTGEAGVFAFHVEGGSSFTIEGVQRSSGEGILIAGVVVDDYDTVIVPSGIIRKTGAIKILLSGNIDTSDAYVYISGTTISAVPNDTSDFVLLESVPAGITPSVFCSDYGGSAVPKAIADSVPVAPGVTTVIVYQPAAYSAKLLLNTTASGADIAGTVTDFPLLIRLKTGYFDFTQALSDGRDLRFTKSNGDPIPFEIERWDASAGQAEIWAKIDTVYGNDSTQSITMYWGNPDASGNSNGAAVFDTAGGFQGVWHLSEPEMAINRDATVNGYNGVPSIPAPLAVSGIIGGAQQFNGTSTSIEMPGTENSKLNFPENSAYSVSAWVLVDSLDGLHHAIVDKSDLQYGLEVFGPENSWDFYQFNSAKFWDGSRLPATAKQWVYLVGIRSGLEQHLYVNGSYASGIFDSTASTRARDEGGTVMIGMLSNDPETRFFKGKIDEVCLANTARSADWIKLCYMNQNADDRLIIYSK